MSIPIKASKADEVPGEQSTFSVVTSDHFGCVHVRVCNTLLIFVSICLVEVVLHWNRIVVVSLSIFVVVDKMVLSAQWFHTVVVSMFCTVVASAQGIVVVEQSKSPVSVNVVASVQGIVLVRVTV